MTRRLSKSRYTQFRLCDKALWLSVFKPEEAIIDDAEANIKVAKKLGIRTYHIKREELVRNLFENGVLKEGFVD